MKRLLVLVVAMALVFAACSSDSGEGGEEEGDEGTLVACESDMPEDTPVDGVPESFPKPEGVVYTGGEEAGPSFIAEGVFDGDLPDAFEAYKSGFEDSGYDVTKEEQEDRDAEVFFAGEGTTGQVNLFADCETQTKLRITIRPD